jgi:hypothetical protein
VREIESDIYSMIRTGRGEPRASSHIVGTSAFYSFCTAGKVVLPAGTGEAGETPIQIVGCFARRLEPVLGRRPASGATPPGQRFFSPRANSR